MILDCKKVTNTMLKNVKIRTTSLKLQNVYPSLALIRTSKNSFHKYYLNTLKKFAKDTGIRLNIVDILNDNIDEIIKTIDQYNSDFSTHGILLESSNDNIANNIVPFKDVDCLSIPNIGSLMTKEDITQPCIAKGVLSLLIAEGIDLKKSKVLIVTDENTHYLKYLTEMLRREQATITIANNNTYNLSSLFYGSNIIIIANNKVNSVGYELLDDVNHEIEQDIIHGLERRNTYILDLNIHKNSLNEINGNVQYNNVDEIFKYDYLKYINILPAGEYINLALCSLLENTLICANIQHSMLKRTKSFI